MNEIELIEKYTQIENKIPSVFETLQIAGEQLAQDILYFWDIKDNELIRVISLISLHTNIDLTNHIYQPFAFAGLYPNKMEIYDIKPEIYKNGEYVNVPTTIKK